MIKFLILREILNKELNNIKLIITSNILEKKQNLEIILRKKII